MTGLGVSARDLVEVLASESRLREVAAFSASGVVVRADAVETGGTVVPTLVCYRRAGGDGWTPAWAVPTATHAAAVGDGFVYVDRRCGADSLYFRSSDGSPARLLHRAHGRVGVLAPQPGGGLIACTVELPGALGNHPTGALDGSDAVWSDGPEASLGNVRHPGGGWQVWLVPFHGDSAAGPGTALPHQVDLDVPAGAVLTGEAAWVGSTTVLLGASWYRNEGSRRFGLLALGTGDGATRTVLFDGIDLCYPAQSPHSDAVAYLGTSVPVGNEPPNQSACLVDSPSLTLRVLAAPPGTWQRPCGWDGPSRLICTAEEGPQRRVFQLDLVSGRWRQLRTSASVESVQIADGKAAALVSSPDSPPAVEVLDLRSGSTRTVESTELCELPGRLQYLPQRVPGVRGTVASWLCLPSSGSVRGTVAFFHGGPFKSWTEWSWRWNPWPFVADGYAVILVEPPMSLGYGPAVHAGWRRWRAGIAAAAVQQVRNGREELGLEGTSLALMGGSFGGYLALATAAELRPRLAVAHAAPLDFAQVAAGSDVGWQWVREYGSPDGQRARYAAQSLPPRPVEAGTRVLLSHGIRDELVPPTETLRIHRSLIREGVRSEVAFFASEAHPLSRPANVRAWYRWVLDACAEELSPKE